MPKYFELKISLNDIHPPIWRIFLLDASVSFYLLHESIIDVMGWEGSHLYAFQKGKRVITEPEEEGFLDDKHEDSLLVQVDSLLKKRGDTISYLYDFGDNWEHTIEVLNVVEKKESFLARCVDGLRSCPPENCGGIPGYEEVIKLMQNPKSIAYREFVKGFGVPFDPESFNLEIVNQDLEDIEEEMKEEGFWSGEISSDAFHIAESNGTASKETTDEQLSSMLFKNQGWRIVSSSDDKKIDS